MPYPLPMRNTLRIFFHAVRQVMPVEWRVLGDAYWPTPSGGLSRSHGRHGRRRTRDNGAMTRQLRAPFLIINTKAYLYGDVLLHRATVAEILGTVRAEKDRRMGEGDSYFQLS